MSGGAWWFIGAARADRSPEMGWHTGAAVSERACESCSGDTEESARAAISPEAARAV